MQRNKKRSKEQMYALIHQWEKSGLNQKQFLRQQGVAKSSFAYWRNKYLGEFGKSKSKGKGGFIPVKIAKVDYKDSSVGELELVYPNGIRLVCPSNIELPRLKPLIIL